MTSIIDTIDALHAKATPGPWSIAVPRIYGDALHIPGVVGTGCDDSGGNGSYAVIEPDDASLIVTLRNHWSAIARVLRAAKDYQDAPTSCNYEEYNELNAALAAMEKEQ